MIKVDRTAIPKPQVLQANEVQWIQDIQDALDALQIVNTKDNREALKKAKGKYGHEDIKKAIVNMFEGKCAYCETLLVHSSHGDIEHFRPKNRFHLLAVDWDNLLLGCNICNGALYKGTKFPLDANGEPLLINPCIDNPEDHLDFEYDQVTKKFIVVEKDAKGDESIKTYGLNRNRNKRDLLEVRTKYLKKIAFLAMHYHNDHTAKEELDDACQKSSPYSAFACMIRDKFV